MNPLLQEFKTVFGYSITNSDKDDVYSLILDTVIARVYRQFNIVVYTTSITSKIVGKGSSNLYTKFTPLISLTSIKDSSGVEQDLTNYYIEGNKIVVPSITFTRDAAYTVEGVFGFADIDLPSDLKFAILKLANTIYADTKLDTSSIKSASNVLGDRMTQVEIDIPKGVLAILKSYRGVLL